MIDQRRDKALNDRIGGIFQIQGADHKQALVDPQRKQMGEAAQQVVIVEALVSGNKTLHPISSRLVNAANDLIDLTGEVIKIDLASAFQQFLHIEIKITLKRQCIAQLLVLYKAAQIAAAIPNTGLETPHALMYRAICPMRTKGTELGS